MRSKAFLIVACALALGAGAYDAATTWASPAHAQESGYQPVMPPGATTDLPFVNDRANQPVLQTISPDGVAIDPAAFAVTQGQPADAAHAEKSGLPQFNITTFPRQLFWLALTFAFMYLVFARKTLPAIGSVIETRRNRIESDVNAAENLKQEVEGVRGEYEAAIAKAQSDAQALMNDMQAEMKRAAEARDAAFKAKADEQIAALDSRLDTGRTRILAELNTLAADLAVDITNRVAGVKADAGAARSIIDAETGKAKAA